MSHCIFSNDQMADNRQSAWHGLFQPLAQTMSLDSMDSIINHVPAVFSPVHTSPITLQGSNIVLPGFKSTYTHALDGSVIPLGVVGSNYEVVQNEDAIRVFTQALEAGLIQFETTATLDNRKRFFACFSFTQGGRVSILPDDPMFRCIVVMNSHDGNSALKVLITNVRVVCGNTWLAALKSKLTQMVNSRHTCNVMQNLESFEQAINYDDATWKAEEVEALKLMAGVHITGKMAELYLKQTMSARKQLTQAMIDDESKALPEEAAEVKQRKNHVIESIKELHETSACSATQGYRGSVYGWYQSVLEYLQYESGHETKGFDSRLYDQIQGENVDRTRLAFDNALALCR